MKRKYTPLYTILGVLLLQQVSMAQNNRQDSLARLQVQKDSLNDIVYVPYGQQSLRTLSSSVSVARSADIIKNSVYTTSNALYGKLPGLFVLQGSGEPGADAPSFYIRGRSTSAGTTPLILVDGIERNMNAVQVEDIESISVLKDASAAVIYGLRGANGVILIVTKRGQNSKLKINTRYEQNILQPTRQPEFVNSASFVKLYNQARINDGLTPVYTAQQIAGFESGDRYYYPDVNWAKEVLKDRTWGRRANVDVSGGDHNSKYFVSLGYHHVEGLYKNTDMNEGYSTNNKLDNFYFRSNIDVKLRKNWTVSADLFGRLSDRNSPFNGAAGIYDVLYKYPSHLFPVYVQNQVYGGSAVYPNNPVGYVNSMGYRHTTNTLVNATVRTSYDLSDYIKGLTAGISYATDNYFLTQDGYTKQFAVKELLGKDASTGQPILSPFIGKNTPITGYGPGTDSQDRRNTFEATLAYKSLFSQKHNIDAIVVYHQDTQVPDAESPYKYQFISGRANYAYNSRYIAELGMSYSGTEAFAPGRRYGFFPALSVAWVLSEENFLNHNKALTFLKLRASAGRVGNAALLERFSYLRRYLTGSSYVFGSTNASQSGLTPGPVGSEDFTWETANKFDLGIDAKLFNSLSVSLTGFFERRTGILNSENNLLPDIFGGDLPNVNAGIIQNRGIEAAIKFDKQHGKWGYNLGLNLSYAANKVIYQPQVAQPYDYLYREGKQVGQPYILEAVGLFGSAAEISSSPVQSYGPVFPGDIKYKDQNNDGRIDDFDRIPTGQTGLPKWDVGMNLGFNFKGFSVTAFLQAQAGRNIYLGDSPYLFWPFYSTGNQISTYPQQFWTPQTAATADYPRLSLGGNANNYRPSTFWYVNGDFLRIRSLDLGYDLPTALLSHVRIKSCRFFLRGMNLLTVDHLKYADPETQNGYPSMKSYTVGLNLQF